MRDITDHRDIEKTHIECWVCHEFMWISPHYYFKGNIMLKCTCGHYAVIPKYDLQTLERA
jgi:hypothetical protein